MIFKQDIPWHKNKYLEVNFNKKESIHYIFYFQKESLAEQDIDRITFLKEKHYLKIKKWLGVNTDRRISYYLYSSKKEKESLMGDDSFGNAIWKELDSEPKDFEVHVIYNEKCKFVGEHEDTHLLSLPWGLSIYLFCEGLAQYMEDSFMGESLHVVSKRLLQEKKLYSIEFLCDNNNWKSVEPVIIYPQVGSFSKFIIEKYGKDKFKELYQNTSRSFDKTRNLLKIERIYKKGINQLEHEWLDFLKASH